MYDDERNVVKALLYAINIITQQKDENLQRIADDYEEALELIASFELNSDLSLSRTMARFVHYYPDKTSNSLAFAGWMLAALQQRIHERDLPDWEKLGRLIDTTVALLPRSTVH